MDCGHNRPASSVCHGRSVVAQICGHSFIKNTFGWAWGSEMYAGPLLWFLLALVLNENATENASAVSADLK